MWGVEWLRNAFGTPENQEFEMSREYQALRGLLNQMQEASAASAQHMHNHVLELKALLGEVRSNQGQILHRLENIMSAVSDFAAKMKVFTDRQGAAVDGLVADIKTLNDKTTELQNSPGTITPEDQALLNEIETHAGAIADKLDALDAQTPPTPPPA